MRTLWDDLEPLLECLAGTRQPGSPGALWVECARDLARESCGLPAPAYRREHCTLNRSGLPVQLVVPCTAAAAGARLLLEPGPLHRSMGERLAAATRAVAALSQRLALEAAAPAVNAVLVELLPFSAAHLNSWRGGLWVMLGCAPPDIELKLYANVQAPDIRGRWVKAGRALAAAGVSEAGLAHWIAVARHFAPALRPVGLMLEPTRHGLAAVRVYMRAGTVSSRALSEIARALDPRYDIALFERLAALLACETAEWREGGLVLSLDFRAGSDERCLKIDIGRQLLVDDELACVDGIERIGPVIGAGAQALRRTLQAIHEGGIPGGEPLQFVGLGRNPHGDMRLNAYLDPVSPRSKPKRERRRPASWSVATALARAEGYLLHLRAADGSWTDFRLPVGTSDEWVTGYVTAALSDGAAPLDVSKDWLMARLRPESGWGYNRQTSADADSTAWALCALKSRGRADLAGLLDKYSTADGVRTYTDLPAGWGSPHADVTAAAVYALAGGGWTPRGAALATSLMRLQDESGGWRAYWWVDDVYATSLACRALDRVRTCNECPEAFRVRIESCLAAASVWLCACNPQTSFGMAMRLHAAAVLRLAQPWVAELERTLVARQRSDGGWAPEPILRLPSAAIAEPWRDPHGNDRTYCDHNAIFSTASAYAALRNTLRASVDRRPDPRHWADDRSERRAGLL